MSWDFQNPTRQAGKKTNTGKKHKSNTVKLDQILFNKKQGKAYILHRNHKTETN